MKIEHTVLKYRLCKSINQIIFNTVYNIYSGENLLKVQNSYTFSVTSPLFRKTYLMVANFPDEEGFVQVQIVDEGFYTNKDLKTIHSFDSLLDEIKQFLEQHLLDLPVIRDIESLDFVD